MTGANTMNGPSMNQQTISPPNLNSSMEMKPHGPLPDPDSVKMFVGQIPKTMTEEQLRPMFEEFGPVYHLNVLRKNNEHAGCCFVTYYQGKDAESAKDKLHNNKQLPGMKHKIQMKPADHEKNAEERKLFVGMLNKKFSEDDVRVMFAAYGTIESCTVLRDSDNNSKGCAFVQFTHKFMAQNAIKELHQSTIMEVSDGCSSKLVVKIADTIREKEQKRQTQIHQQLFQQFVNTLGPQYMAHDQQQGAYWGHTVEQRPFDSQTLLQMMQQVGGPVPTAAGGGGGAGGVGGVVGGGGGGGGGNNSGNMPNLNNLQQQLNLQGVSMPQLAALLTLSQQVGNNPQAANPLAANPLTHNPSAAALTAQQNNSIMGLSGGMAGTPTQPSAGGLQGFPGMTGTNNITTPGGIGNNANSTKRPECDLNTLSQAYSGIQQYVAAFHNGFGMFGANQQSQQQPQHNKQTEGPEGCNLFIYHLPPDFGDYELHNSFSPFGTVLSAKVYIDKKTNLSKCFGFVSFNDPSEAQSAIQAMNGFQIGTKRLKVQLKRAKDKPY
ncbi:CUGBP Elav-like family member 1 isoform X13 [Apostichopus japonicus]|uniref:CUGBP Elav-like family member 1 isoform X13 n=1 Tax=Stichopus japonicus TaxID=307972 RepID=UPI003AB703DF